MQKKLLEILELIMKFILKHSYYYLKILYLRPSGLAARKALEFCL